MAYEVHATPSTSKGTDFFLLGGMADARRTDLTPQFRTKCESIGTSAFLRKAIVGRRPTAIAGENGEVPIR